MPFDLYSTFVIEENFGFNKMKLGTFIMDKIKGYLLAVVLGGLLIGSLFTLVVSMGENFWIIFWLIVSSLLVLLNMFYTSLIVPLFNKLTPLEDGELRQAIEAYSKKINFELNDIYVVDGSKRSSKANAYFSGIGKKKKIVLYDTLIEKNTPEELVAVLAHEVGHFKRKHIISTMIISVLQVGAILFLLSKVMFSTEVSVALGAETLTPVYHLNLIAFGFLFTPLSKIIGILMSLFSRKNEYEADAYAKETFSGEALSSALKNLSVHNLSNLTPHPAYVFMHYSHPTLLERLEALEK
jgi:STE24 endopeptidase